MKSARKVTMDPEAHTLAGIVDLDRYPLHDLRGAVMDRLLGVISAELTRSALTTLPGFLTAAACRTMADELLGLAPDAFHGSYDRNAYSWLDCTGFADDHPRAIRHLEQVTLVTYNMYGRESPTRRLYESEALTEFVAAAVGEDVLYRVADEILGLEGHVLAPGDHHGWHFDRNDFVVSLLLGKAESGGHFEHAPYVRSEDDENYDEVKRVFDGTSPLVKRVEMEPGDLVLFRGRRSLHHVTTVEGAHRLILVFSYNRRPGHYFAKDMVNRVTQNRFVELVAARP